jgi:hypothetical protein
MEAEASGAVERSRSGDSEEFRSLVEQRSGQFFPNLLAEAAMVAYGRGRLSDSRTPDVSDGIATFSDGQITTYYGQSEIGPLGLNAAAQARKLARACLVSLVFAA